MYYRDYIDILSDFLESLQNNPVANKELIEMIEEELNNVTAYLIIEGVKE